MTKEKQEAIKKEAEGIKVAIDVLYSNLPEDVRIRSKNAELVNSIEQRAEHIEELASEV